MDIENEIVELEELTSHPTKTETVTHNEIPVYVAEAKIQEEERQTRQKRKKLGLPKLRDRFKKKKTQRIISEPITEHSLSLSDIARQYGSRINVEDPKLSEGLDEAVAANTLQLNGPNALTPKKTTPTWVRLMGEFTAFFPLLLEGGGVLCFVAYALDNSTMDNLYLGVILWLVVIITGLFSFSQQSKSSALMAGFLKMQASEARVIRNGKLKLINATQLVVGDVVDVRMGDKIPADLRLIYTHEFKVDNSSFTGEAEPQSRKAEKTDDNPLETQNLAFFSTLACEGDAIGVVVRTGDHTVIGNIAELATSTVTGDTPLQKELHRFIKYVSIVAVCLGVLFFGLGFAMNLYWLVNIVLVIGIIVANVPEGLLPTVTVGLSLTAKRMAKKNILVKNLVSVETLGSCSTICSDKTGTLTQNRMTVVHVAYDDNIFVCDDIPTPGLYDRDHPSFQALQLVATICNRAVFTHQENCDDISNVPIQQRATIGDASESALIKFCEPLGSVVATRVANPKLFEIPFNSTHKWQLSIHQTERGLLLALKGAPERVIDKCTKILINGEERPLTRENLAAFNRNYEALAGRGERVLGFAHLWLDPNLDISSFDDNLNGIAMDDLVFVGLMALMDPPRNGVPEAIAMCKQAGIRVIMVTGDHPLTAKSIARQVGIIEGETAEDISQRLGIPLSEVDPTAVNAVVVKGSEVDELNTEDWDRILMSRQIVFARTSPAQKLKIVEQVQNRGDIVAVTGDGVNDSPALKKADLGCAMGISGSDVSKEAAAVILLDDNFASIVSGIKEGRIIFDNLRKSIAYTLSSNTTELAPFFAFLIARIPLALSAVLILCIDLGTDLVPAISLAYEKPESDIMHRAPRNPKKDRLVTMPLALYSYVWFGVIQTCAGFLNYFLVMSKYGYSPSDLYGTATDYFRDDSDVFSRTGHDANKQMQILREAQTAYFVAIVISRIGVLLSCKTRTRSLLQQGMINMVLNLGVSVELGLAIILTYVPGIQDVFQTHPLEFKFWLIPLCFFAFIVVAEELRKYLHRNKIGIFKYSSW